jgi:hypothetical protein
MTVDSDFLVRCNNAKSETLKCIEAREKQKDTDFGDACVNNTSLPGCSKLTYDIILNKGNVEACKEKNSQTPECRDVYAQQIKISTQKRKINNAFCKEKNNKGVLINENSVKCRTLPSSSTCNSPPEEIDCGTTPDSELKPTMNATGACIKIAEMKARLDKSSPFADFIPGKIFIDGINDFASTIGEAINSSSKNIQEVNNIMGTKTTSKQISDSIQECKNKTDIYQTNIFKGYSKECQENIVNSDMGEDAKAKIILAMTSDLDGLSQSNDSSAFSDCVASSVTTLFASATSDVANTALQKAVAATKGIMASANNSQTGCNDISSELTVCQYMRSKQCCENIIRNDQLNSIDQACSTSLTAKNVIQKNKSLAYATCSLTAETTMSADLVAKITNRSDQTAKAKSDGIDVNALFNALALAYVTTILGGIFGTAILGYGLVKSKGIIVIIAGIIILAIGIGNLAVYSSSKKKEKDIVYEDSARSICDDVKSEPIIRPSTYGNAIEYAKNIDAVGFDFFVSNLKSGSSEFKIQDDTEGRAIFITELPDDIDYEDDCKNMSDLGGRVGKVAIRTTIFGEKTSPLLRGLGIACVVLGIVCVIAGGYLMYIQTKQNTRDAKNADGKADGKAVEKKTPLRRS